MSTINDTATPVITTSDAKQLIDQYLAEYSVKKRAESLLIGTSYSALWDTIDSLFKAGGKRFRPYMTLLAYQTFAEDKDITDIIPAAASQELLHIAMLIHDDIIDRDTTRWGIPNITGQYDTIYSNLVKDPTERRHYAEASALLAGDVLLSEAHLILFTTCVPSINVFKAQNMLAQSVFRVVGGELLDTEAAFQPREAVDSLAIATEKTASYSFIGPLLAGAYLAGATDEDVAHMTRFGHALGIAYQLQDDLLGVYGDEEVFGKSVTSDITEGKRTYLIQKFYELADADQIRIFESYFGKQTATPAEIETVRKLLVDSGAKAAVEEKIKKYAAETYSELASMELPAEYDEAYTGLIKKCIERTK